MRTCSELNAALRPILTALLLWAGARASGLDAPSAKHEVRSSGIAVRLSAQGEIVGAALGAKGLERAVAGRTHLAGCRVGPEVASQSLPGGGVQFRKTLIREEDQRPVRLTERFLPTQDSVRWEIEIADDGKPWSTAIETQLRYPAPPAVKLWAAWADPRNGKVAAMKPEELIAQRFLPEAAVGEWADPLVPVPMGNATFWYGAPHYRYDNPMIGYCPFRRDVICIPLATVVEEGDGLGLSLVLSPEDLLLDIALTTTEAGQLAFSRVAHRLGEGRELRFAMDLVAHEASWRGGLRWMTRRYAPFFDPPNPMAHEVVGTGAYSTRGTDFDAEKLRAMAFGVNWKASFDFPYMGMFLPPVADDVPWRRYGGGTMSIAQMRDYSRAMRQMGFYVLNYFNVTEFGAGVAYPPPQRKAASDADLWEDANDFLYGKLKDAILFIPENEKPPRPGQPYRTWGDALAMDPGEPAYQEFLLEQARRHIEKLPDSSGICIDRMDWLRLYNHRRDDGVSWFAGKPARSLLVSWRDIMARLGPLMHDAGKVVYCNNHIKRIEQMRHIDGIFDEFTYGGCPLNTVALMCVRKPAIGWTAGEANLRPDPDAFFQKYLYLGVFPTAPFPSNDHCLLPSAWVDQQYLDYGPPLAAMRGKRWVLEPHSIELDGKAKANLFEISGGFLLPVVFAGKAEKVSVAVRGFERICGSGPLIAEAIHPGSGTWLPLQVVRKNGDLALDVPVRRGCAVVRLVQVSIRGHHAAFVRSTTVEIVAAAKDAEVRYTADGTVPTQQSPLYKGPLELTSSATVAACVFTDGKGGPVATATFSKVPLGAPAIVPNGGLVIDSVSVKLMAPWPAQDAGIRYTLDGGEPTANSPRYSGPVTLTRAATIRARAFLPGEAPGPVASASFTAVPPLPPVPDVHLSELLPIKATVGWGDGAKPNRSIQGKPLSIRGKQYEKGMGVHAVSELVYELKPDYRAFVAVVGVDDEMKGHEEEASAVFQVFVDDGCLAQSPVVRLNGVWHFNVPIPQGSRRLRLVVTDAGDGINCDHGDWANAGLLLAK